MIVCVLFHNLQVNSLYEIHVCVSLTSTLKIPLGRRVPLDRMNTITLIWISSSKLFTHLRYNEKIVHMMTEVKSVSERDCFIHDYHAVGCDELEERVNRRWWQRSGYMQVLELKQIIWTNKNMQWSCQSGDPDMAPCKSPSYHNITPLQIDFPWEAEKEGEKVRETKIPHCVNHSHITNCTTSAVQLQDIRMMSSSKTSWHGPHSVSTFTAQVREQTHWMFAPVREELNCQGAASGTPFSILLDTSLVQQTSRRRKSCWWNAAISMTLWLSLRGRPETGRYMASLLLWIPDPAIISDSTSGVFNLGFLSRFTQGAVAALLSPFPDLLTFFSV